MQGYADLASMMGRYPDTGILRRFGTLNMQNLLYLQAELIKLESELHELAKTDSDQGKSGNRVRGWYSKDWISLSNYYGSTDETQWQKVLQIRRKLKEYSKRWCFRLIVSSLYKT